MEAHRLRKRLREYYEAEGADHRVRIDIPPGQYAPHFVRQLPPKPSLSEEALVAPPVLDLDNELEEVPTTQDVAPLHHPVSIGAPQPLLLAPPPAKSAVRIWIALALSASALCGVLLWKMGASKPNRVVAAPVVGTAPGPPNEVRILAGLESGTYVDRFGKTWQSDRYFQGGAVFESTGHPIAAARDPRLFRSRREGAFTYDIPLPAGVYELRLYFAETLYGENNVAGGGETSRIFNVNANGAPILSGFDVIGEVGASTADVRAFKDISPAPDGKLHLKFDPQTNPAIVSAIEITPGTPGRLRPIRTGLAGTSVHRQAGPHLGGR